MMYCHEEHKACLWEDVDDGEEQPGQQQLRYLAPQAGEDDNDGDYDDCNCDYEDYDDSDYGDVYGGQKKKPEKHRDRGDTDDDGEDDDDDDDDQEEEEEAEET